MLKFSKTVRVGAVALIIGAAGFSMNAGASAESTPSAEQLAPVDIVAVSGLLDDVVACGSDCIAASLFLVYTRHGCWECSC